MSPTTEVVSKFATEVDAGLSSQPKHLPSKWFYDQRGDALFQQIMAMPEYYLTRAEFEILTEQTDEVIEALDLGDNPFEMYELGAGDGLKTVELLRHLPNEQFTFYPIDISANALELMVSRLKVEVPNLQVEGMQGMYFGVLDNLESDLPKVILFLGSSLGNLSDDRAKLFISHLAEVMAPGDKLLLGLDRKKEAEKVLPAYDDPRGLTREFNLNLLRRINRELSANFNVDGFRHSPRYNEEMGQAESYLVSKRDQKVYIGALDKTYHFEKGERIHTEISRKYDLPLVKSLLEGTGLVLRRVFEDQENLFMDLIIEKTT